jgi:hypothetical protein
LYKTLTFKPDWNKTSFKTPEYIPDGLTKELLLDWQGKMNRSFYRRPNKIWHLAKMVKPQQIGKLIQRVKEFHVVK